MKIVINGWNCVAGWLVHENSNGEVLGYFSSRSSDWPDQIESDCGAFDFPDFIYIREVDSHAYWVTSDGTLMACPAFDIGLLDFRCVMDVSDFEGEPLVLSVFEEIESVFKMNTVAIKEDTLEELKKHHDFFYKGCDNIPPFSTS